MQSSNFFDVHTKRNAQATKVIYYLTSYKFPWWIYYVPVRKLLKNGYEVVVYDFKDHVLENDDPAILPKVVAALNSDINTRQAAYEKRGITTAHGIGNSLGSYFIFNYALLYPIDAVVINAAGSIADIIFSAPQRKLRQVARTYASQGYDSDSLRTFWAASDDPEIAKHVKAKRVLVSWSKRDGMIPTKSTQAFIDGLLASNREILTITNKLPHIPSVLAHAHRTKMLINFLNKPDS